MIAFSAGQWKGVDGMGAEILMGMRPRAAAAVERAAMLFTSELQRTLTGKRSGRIYYIGKSRREHQASAPGEPPAVLTGRLRQSMAWTKPHWDGNTVTSEVGTNVVYAARLEYGGMDSHGRMIQKRPYFAPTILRIEGAIHAIFEAVL